jgi:hypothetical protein
VHIIIVTVAINGESTMDQDLFGEIKRETVKCAECGKEFVKTSSNKRFCHVGCRIRYQNKINILGRKMVHQSNAAE